MTEFFNRLFRLEPGEWPKLLQFGMFGFLLQMGMGIGFSAGDAAFLSNVGADSLPLVFMLTPAVMLLYTVVFSYLLVRYSIAHMVEFTLGALVFGGVALWALIGADLPPEWQTALYFVLKLYLAMWYIALYSLFWNFTDAYFDIQDAKRLFPLFAAFCALGTASGALVVSLFADRVPLHGFFLLWAVIALATTPLTRLLRRRWKQLAENDAELDEKTESAASQLAAVGRAFASSRYTRVFTLTLFGTLLMTNLAEYQYSKVLQEGRSEAELASLFGILYACANIFNLVTCLFVFNRLVARFGVRNVAFVQPLTYFAVFGYFFLQGGTGAALAAFFAYHGVLTSIEYNNENLLFNAVPSQVKRPLRTMVEGLCEPLASLVAGGFLLYAANYVDMRELSGIGIIIGAILIAIVVALRQLYPAAMAANMRHGWMNFGDAALAAPAFAPDARQLLEEECIRPQSHASQVASRLLAGIPPGRIERAPSPEADALLKQLDAADPLRRAKAITELARVASQQDIHLVAPLTRRLPELASDERRQVIALLADICDSESIPDILLATSALAPRERRAVAALLARIGETAIPRLNGGLRDRALAYRARAVAGRALAAVSNAQFASQVALLVDEELLETRRLLNGARYLESRDDATPALQLLARAMHERVAASVDFVLELLAIGGQLPNFDLLIVSLHSANPKVRGNAIETIESGIDARLFRLLEPLLLAQKSARPDPLDTRAGDLAGLLEEALASGQPIEMAAAADVLHDTVEPPDFAARVRRVINRDTPQLVRRHLLTLMGLAGSPGPDLLDILIALGRDPEVGGATLEALAALAERARDEQPGEPALMVHAGDRPFWITRHALADVAGRFPDLALVMLKSQDNRQYAA